MIDEKAAFYLRHRREIEEWVALRSSAARLVDQTLVSRFTDWSGEDDGAARSTADLLEGAWPRVYLAGSDWRQRGVRLALVLEWNRSRLLGGSRAPYLGVRVPTDQPSAKALREGVKARRPRLREAGLDVNGGDTWPTFRWVEVPDDAEVLGAWADQCALDLETTWSYVRAVLQEVVDEVATA